MSDEKLTAFGPGAFTDRLALDVKVVVRVDDGSVASVDEAIAKAQAKGPGTWTFPLRGKTGVAEAGGVFVKVGAPEESGSESRGHSDYPATPWWDALFVFVTFGGGAGISQWWADRTGADPGVALLWAFAAGAVIFGARVAYVIWRTKRGETP